MTTEQQKDNEIAELTVGDLICKQSVRATFKLPGELIKLLGMISGQLGIKQKSLLDQLIEDRTGLKRLAEKVRESESINSGLRQKTFVLSRSTLNTINSIAKQYQVPRDLIVEVSIRRLLPLIETELEKHHQRKIIRREMREYLLAGEKLKKKTSEFLGTDDEIYIMLEKQLNQTEKNIAEIDALIEKGMAMEDW